MTGRFFLFITHFGDAALLIPLSLAIIFTLIWSGHRLAALRFAVAVAILMAATVALKIGFYAIGGDAALDVLSPSGHAGFSVTVYGCCAAMLAKQCRPAGAAFVIAAAAALLATVLASRVVLGTHTLAEVVLGCALGLICIASFLMWNPELDRLHLRLSAPLAAVLAVLSLSVWEAARQFNTERRIEHAGILVGSTLGTLVPSDFKPGHTDTIRRLDGRN
jgi:membrane-associated phospholipid phosphatase